MDTDLTEPADLADLDALDALDAEALLGASAAVVRARRLAEVADLRVLLQWAVLHAADPTQGPDGHVARKVGNVLVRVGGEGTPGVQDFCLGEIALARSTGVVASINALADVLDLTHRLPATWAQVTSGAAEPWVARRVAKLSRHLPLDCVHVVDAAVARIIARESAGRVLDHAAAKIIEAAPGLHEQRAEEERRRRFVALSRGDESGLRTVIARVTAGDATWVMATLERVSQIIAPGPSRPGRGGAALAGLRVAGPPRRAAGPAARTHRDPRGHRGRARARIRARARVRSEARVRSGASSG